MTAEHKVLYSRLKQIMQLNQENSNLVAFNRALLERNKLLETQLERLREKQRGEMWLRNAALKWRLTQEAVLEKILGTPL